MPMQGFPLVIKPEAYFAMRDERDRLRGINAELVGALEKIQARSAKALPYPAEEYAATADECWEMARAALDKARKEG